MPSYHIESLPKAIWTGGLWVGNPSCYHGEPEEILASMAKEFGPKVGFHDAVRIIVQDIHEKRGLRVNLPKNAPKRITAALLIAALLASGFAKETPQA